MPPAADTNGNLPPGVHHATWDEVVVRWGVTAYRKRLLNGLELAIDALRACGCKQVYLDGSFVTEKDVPGDFDAAWDPNGVDLTMLRSIEPTLFEFKNGRAAQKARFGGELFPSSAQADLIGNTYLDFFQLDSATGSAKGIIAISL